MKSLSSAKKRRLTAGLPIFLILLGLSFVAHKSTILQRLELLSLDLRFEHTNFKKAPSDEVTVLLIDERSLATLESSYGRWPWPRRVYKEIVEYLAQAEPAGIYFDLLSSEPQKDGEDDALFAEAISRIPQVSVANLFLGEKVGETPYRHIAKEKFHWKVKGIPPKFLKNHPGLALSVEPYIQSAHRAHAINSGIDELDKVARRSPLFLQNDDFWLPNLGVNAWLHSLGGPQALNLNWEESSLKVATKTPKEQIPFVQKVPIDDFGNVLLRWYSLKNGDPQFKYFSFSNVLIDAQRLQNGQIEDLSQLEIPWENFKGKHILIGTSAAALGDIKNTPVMGESPGVLVHATVLSNLLQGDFLNPTSPIFGSIISIILMCITFFSYVFIESFALKTLVPLLSAFFYFAVTIFFFQKPEGAFSLPMAVPALFVFSFIDGLRNVLYVEGKDKKKAKETLAKFLDPRMVEKMMHEGIDLSAEVGARKEVSILFSDIRGFTTFSERNSEAPEKVVKILNTYLGEMTKIVFEFGGTLDKFIGDAVMAFWGTPIDDPKHAQNAVLCAFRMREALDRLNQEWLKNGSLKEDELLKIGIGVNTGMVIAGNIGSDRRLDFTVIGDQVNLASRIESSTKAYGATLLIGPKTNDAISELVLTRIADNVRVKGKATAVRLYEPLAEWKSLNPEEGKILKSLVDRYHEAFAKYEKGEFPEAHRLWGDLQKVGHSENFFSENDQLIKVFIERCEIFMKKTYRYEWDGIFERREK